MPEENIGDDQSPAESEAIYDAINRALVTATTAETAVKMSGKQFRGRRLRRKKAFEQDSRQNYAVDQTARTERAVTASGNPNTWKRNTSTLSSSVLTRSPP